MEEEAEKRDWFLLRIEWVLLMNLDMRKTNDLNSSRIINGVTEIKSIAPLNTAPSGN